MNNPTKALFPAVLLGILIVIGLTRLLFSPSETVQASNLQPTPLPVSEENPDEVNNNTVEREECAISDRYPEKSCAGVRTSSRLPANISLTPT